jgi:ANTAR domain/GAF domain
VPHTAAYDAQTPASKIVVGYWATCSERSQVEPGPPSLRPEGNGLPGDEPTSDAATSDSVDLRASLADLSGLVMDSRPGGLEELLRHVAALAVRAIPGADGAGLTLLEQGQPDTLVASAEFVTEVDRIQYSLGQGPCITAAAEGHTVVSGSLQLEKRWPRFGPRVAVLGVHSVLSLPLMGPAGALGAMNVYAHVEDAFGHRAIELGELFAVPAAISVRNAQVLAQTKRVVTRLQSALTSRSVIDQALGIVISRSGCNADEAFQKLVTISQAENRKVSAVAQHLVEEARRRARARHIDG